MRSKPILHSAIAIPALAALVGCSSAQAGAEAAVRENLKDPDSARFGEFYYNSETQKACLTTNAKNSMGGYTGDKQAMLFNEDGTWVFAGTHETDQATCKEIFADQAPTE